MGWNRRGVRYGFSGIPTRQKLQRLLDSGSSVTRVREQKRYGNRVQVRLPHSRYEPAQVSECSR